MAKDETYAGEFYCVKCKEKRTAEGKVVVSENGRRMAKATCPTCGTNLNRILGKASFGNGPREGDPHRGSPSSRW